MLDAEIRHRQDNFTLDVAFTAGAGLTALFGPSGSGKTTIIQVLSGLVRPDFARVVFDGETWNDSASGTFVPPHRRRIGYVFQEGRLFPHMTVEQNLLYGTRFQPQQQPRQAQARELARIGALLGITPLFHRRPAALSGGEKQRVALGRALMAAPRLLLMDEPLSALDAAIKAEILPDLERIRDVEGIPVLYVSHSVGEITRLATRVITLDHGRIGSAVPMASGGMPAGSFIEATVTAQWPEDGLTEVQSPAGNLYLRQVELQMGARLRLFLPATDVTLATTAASGLSSLNRLQGVVERCTESGHAVSVTVRCSGVDVLASVTRRSVRELGLGPGMPVTVLFKALSIAPENLFRPG